MTQEYLPILERRGDKLKVTGKMERSLCHGKNPSFHGTAIIAAVLPDGRILLADKTEKQQKKRRQAGKEPLPEGLHIYDIFGGHMQYEDIPECEKEGFVSQETYRRCALRELSEELLVFREDGSYAAFRPGPGQLVPLGFYEMSNDHNREYTWAFVCFLDSMGPFISQDTLQNGSREEEIRQPLHAVDWEELLSIFDNNFENRQVSDAIGRILKTDRGVKLHKSISRKCTD